MGESRLRTASARCPCCGYVTLHERGGYEICPLCGWEDDGQDHPHADEVWGGPNGDLSLAEARRNFRDHLTMYRAGEDTRVGGEDSPAEARAKRAILAAFHRLSAHPPAPEVERLWASVDENEAVLDAELHRRIWEYEQRGDGEPSV